jgi:hypothetical protein
MDPVSALFVHALCFGAGYGSRARQVWCLLAASVAPLAGALTYEGWWMIGAFLSLSAALQAGYLAGHLLPALHAGSPEAAPPRVA